MLKNGTDFNVNICPSGRNDSYVAWNKTESCAPRAKPNTATVPTIKLQPQKMNNSSHFFTEIAFLFIGLGLVHVHL